MTFTKYQKKVEYIQKQYIENKFLLCIFNVFRMYFKKNQCILYVFLDSAEFEKKTCILYIFYMYFICILYVFLKNNKKCTCISYVFCMYF